MRLIAALVFCVLLSGCASSYKPVPEHYTGPTAIIADSGVTENFAKAQMFVVAAIDGHIIDNSLHATESASQGQGPLLIPSYVKRQIQATPQRIKLVGTHVTTAPIVALISMAAKSYQHVEGEIVFSPAPGGSYIVLGALSDTGSSVWIADVNTGKRVSEIIRN